MLSLLQTINNITQSNINTQQADLKKIFYFIDEFCENFNQNIKTHSLTTDTTKRTRNKKLKKNQTIEQQLFH